MEKVLSISNPGIQTNNDRLSLFSYFGVTKKSNCVTKLSVSLSQNMSIKLIMGNYGHVIGFCPDTIRTGGQRTGDKARFINHKTQKVSFSFIFINLLWSITGITSDLFF